MAPKLISPLLEVLFRAKLDELMPSSRFASAALPLVERKNVES